MMEFVYRSRSDNTGTEHRVYKKKTEDNAYYPIYDAIGTANVVEWANTAILRVWAILKYVLPFSTPIFTSDVEAVMYLHTVAETFRLKCEQEEEKLAAREASAQAAVEAVASVYERIGE